MVYLNMSVTHLPLPVWLATYVNLTSLQSMRYFYHYFGDLVQVKYYHGKIHNMYLKYDNNQLLFFCEIMIAFNLIILTFASLISDVNLSLQSMFWFYIHILFSL